MMGFNFLMLHIQSQIFKFIASILPWNYLVAKKNKRRTKNGENMPSLEVVDVVLVQYNMVDSQYQQKFGYYILLLVINIVHIFLKVL